MNSMNKRPHLVLHELDNTQDEFRLVQQGE